MPKKINGRILQLRYRDGRLVIKHELTLNRKARFTRETCLNWITSDFIEEVRWIMYPLE